MVSQECREDFENLPCTDKSDLRDAYSLGLQAEAKAVDIGDLPRSEKKTARIFDNRY